MKRPQSQHDINSEPALLEETANIRHATESHDGVARHRLNIKCVAYTLVTGMLNSTAVLSLFLEVWVSQLTS